MNQTVTPRTKYLDLPEEIRNRIVKIYTTGAELKKKMQDQALPMTDEVSYWEIEQELEMAGINTEEVKNRVQEKLAHLEEIRDYVKEATAEKKDQRSVYLADIIKKEMEKANRQLNTLEEKMHALVGSRKTNVLQSIQMEINRLSKKMEHI